MKNDCGHVYLLKNESMPGLYKIGYTTQDVDSRVDQLSKSTGVPTDFECIYAANFDWFTRPFNIEQMVHKKLSERRVSNKEFFRFKDDAEAQSLTVFAMLSSCIDIISTEHGSEWISDRVTIPHMDTERRYIDHKYKGSEIQNRISYEASIIQSDMITAGDIENLAVLYFIGFMDVLSGSIMLIDLGYTKNIYGGIYIYLRKADFFDRWLHKMCKVLEVEMSSSNSKEELVH